MSNTLNRIVGTAIASAVALLCAGCGSDKEVSFKSGGMTHTFAEGSEAVPKDFPIPLYPGATPTGSVSAKGGEDEQSNFLMLQTPDPAEKVQEFYKNQFTQAGWQLDNSQSDSPKAITVGAHKDNVEAQVLATEDSGMTAISISLGKAGAITKEDTDANNDDYKPDKVTPPTD